MDIFKIGKVYTFNTKAPGILGTTIIRAKLLAVLDFSTALSYDNITLKYRTIYPLLPKGTPDSPGTCIYYKFKSQSGEDIILADQWIEESSVEVIEHVSFSVHFTQASIQDISRVRDALNARGLTEYSIVES